MVKGYDTVIDEQAETLAGYEFGGEVAEMPRRRGNETWSEEERKRYFKWDSVALYVPLTNKHDMAKYADILAGLATKLKYLAGNSSLSDREAVFDQVYELDDAKRKLKRAGGLDQKPSGKNK